MASTFDNDLRLEEMATGENAGSWGTKTNTNLELIADAFGYGTFTIADADTTLTMPDGSDTDNALRSLYLKINSSADLTTTRTLTLAPNTVSKLWYIENNTSGGQTITISQGSGANVSILNGQAKLIATDGAGAGAAVIDATQDLAIPDLFIDDDLSLQSDGAIINFGADADVSLTHVADTGLRLNAAMALEFRDGDLSINSSADGQLDIDADTKIEITSTNVDIDGIINVGEDDTGYDVKFFGATSGKYMLWDESADTLAVEGDLKIDTDTLYVDSTNDYVGINQGSPSYSLDIKGNSSTTHGIRLLNSDAAITGGQVLSQVIFENSDDSGGIQGNYYIKNVAADGFAATDLDIQYDRTGGAVSRLKFTDASGYLASIFNDAGEDVDFRVESDGKTHMLFVDAGNNVVSINNAENQSAFVLNVVGTNVSGGRVAKLAGGDVNTATSTSAPHLVIENNNTTTGNFSALAFASSNGGTTAFIGAKNTNHTTHSGDLYIATRGPANGYLNKVFIGDSSMVINESGVAYTFRVESDTNSHALYVEPTNSRVGINNSTPSEQLTVNGSALFQEAEAEVRIYNNGSDPAEWRLMSSSNAGATAAFRIYNQTTTSNTFWIAGSTNAGSRAGNVGINNSSPQGILHLDQGTDNNGLILAYSGRGVQRHQWELSGVNNQNSTFFQYNGTDKQNMLIMGRDSVTINDSGADQDFRVESASQSHMLWVDAGSNVLHMGGYVTAGQDGARIMFNGNKGYQGTGVANDMLNIRDTTSHGTTDNGGAIVFSGQYASGSYTSFAEIHGIKTNNTSSNYDGDLLFKRRLNGGSMYTQGMSQYGYLKWANDGVSNHTYHDSNTHSFSTDKNFASVSMGSTNLAMTRRVLITATKQSSSSSYYQIESWSGDGTNVYTDREFGLRGDGNAYADGSWNGGGADYAEYFEWADGNTANEDRRGYSVVLENNMMRKATSSDDVSKIIGVISGSPAVVGDHAENRWADKFVKDDFGSIVWDEHEVWEWEETYTDDDGVEQTRKVSYESWSIPSDITPPADKTVLTHDENGNPFKHRRLNPTFDPDVEYIPRSERPEWDCVGLMGKLRLRKGQPTGANWIKMRDISADVEEWLVR